VTARGFFSIGIWHGKTEINVGSLWRTAAILGAAEVFTVGRRYKAQASDTMRTWAHTPLRHYEDVDDLKKHLPFSTLLVGVELDHSAAPLADFQHPERAVYLLGAEDHGLSPEVVRQCHRLVRLPGEQSLNVAVAGSIVVYDRVTRGVAPMRRLA
jgi:tRNA G18 (ribose-2'-O)-methylase SpoU